MHRHRTYYLYCTLIMCALLSYQSFKNANPNPIANPNTNPKPNPNLYLSKRKQ